ncbi:hypothetical protein [Trichormus sp. NMC-1]|uniref:hypothetical protein n=1 Tax=Trichormus sp. NMC-1 TaxID=1853259 RepID=UPI0015A63D74|nr:hypothetical protein [Trichormus sp. NMC-1]
MGACTDVIIRQQPKLDNIKLLYKYAITPLTIQNYLDFQRYFSFVNSLNLQVDGEGNSDSDSDWLFGEGLGGVGSEDVDNF